MIEEGLIGPHCILIIAERREPVRDKIVQRYRGIFGGNGQLKISERSRMVGEGLVDECGYVSCDLVGRKRVRSRQQQSRASFAEALTIVRIVVPLAADRLRSFHEHASLLTHIAIEKLHAQLRVSLRPGCEFRAAAVEIAIRADVESDSGFRGDRLEHAFDAILARFDDNDSCGLERSESRVQLGRKLTPVGAVIEPTVFEPVASGAHLLGKMPHRREKVCNADFVRKHVSRFTSYFGHPDEITRFVEVIEGGRFKV